MSPMLSKLCLPKGKKSNGKARNKRKRQHLSAIQNTRQHGLGFPEGLYSKGHEVLYSGSHMRGHLFVLAKGWKVSLSLAQLSQLIAFRSISVGVRDPLQPSYVSRQCTRCTCTRQLRSACIPKEGAGIPAGIPRPRTLLQIQELFLEMQEHVYTLFHEYCCRFACMWITVNPQLQKSKKVVSIHLWCYRHA